VKTLLIIKSNLYFREYN